MADAEDPELALHRDIASRMGRQCALRRARYYHQILDSLREQERRTNKIALVYHDRADEADSDEDCEG